MKESIITVPVFVHRRRDWEGHYAYSVHSSDMAEYGYVPVLETKVVVTLPPKATMILAEIEMLDKKLTNVRATAYSEAEAIREEIQKLLYLEKAPEFISNPGINNDDEIPF